MLRYCAVIVAVLVASAVYHNRSCVEGVYIVVRCLSIEMLGQIRDPRTPSAGCLMQPDQAMGDGSVYYYVLPTPYLC